MDKVLLTHHKKLGRWLQLGGHCDGEKDARLVALKEAQEESGIKKIELISCSAVDIDIHKIPRFRETSPHLHYDLRYLLCASSDERIICSDESNALAWVDLDNLEQYTKDQSILRVRKVISYFKNGQK